MAGQIWLTSDQHFLHHNIIAFCHRPYSDPEAMSLGLVERHNAVVAPADTVYVLGDWALGKINDSLRFTGLLNGHLILVPGNHDRCWQGLGPRAQGWDEKYLAAGFADIQHNPAPLQVGAHQVNLSHFPYRGQGDSQDIERHPEFRLEDDGRWLFHGHVHNRWRQQGRKINVGVDAWGGQPVSLTTLTGLIEAGPQDLTPLRWV